MPRLGKNVLIHEQILSVYCWMLDDVLLYIFNIISIYEFLHSSHRCVSVHRLFIARKQTAHLWRTSTNSAMFHAKNVNLIKNMQGKTVFFQIFPDMELITTWSTDFLPQISLGFGHDHSSHADLEADRYPWMIRRIRIGMSDRLDGFFMCFLCLFDGFSFVCISYHPFLTESGEIIGILMLQVQRISSSCVFSLPETGPFASNKSGSLSIWTLEIKMDPVPPLLKKNMFVDLALKNKHTQNNKV